MAVSTATPRVLDMPLGDRDSKPKIQLCCELRDKKLSKSKKAQKVLEVTVIWVKNLPKNPENLRPNPFVKLRIHPGTDLFTTELKTESDAKFIETFEFPVNRDNLKGIVLQVEVCDRKSTRNAKCFGDVNINLDHLETGKPQSDWFNLDVSAPPEDQNIDLKQSNKIKDKKSGSSTPRNTPRKR